MNNNRNKLISLAVKYNGNYEKIKRAVIRGEGDPNFQYENAITVLDDDYPIGLFELKEPPFVLFYKGDKSLLNEKNKLAVVGTRRPSDYSFEATVKYVRNQGDRVIISGFAKGTDTIAHSNANKTIAVLGCGIDLIYPMGNKDLYDYIAEEGLIISEYPFNVEPTKEQFLFRNRIIAGLAEEVAVMEAVKNSSVIKTLNYAMELDKKINVLPFPITDERAINNQLIKDGAGIICSVLSKEWNYASIGKAEKRS